LVNKKKYQYHWDLKLIVFESNTRMNELLK
jgi:hypothetical protein